MSECEIFYGVPILLFSKQNYSSYNASVGVKMTKKYLVRTFTSHALRLQ